MSEKKRLVILGGGIGGLTTAVALTDDPDWRDRFESITLYQLGWRLGGKGASGRGEFGRIEEHGLHVWMGFYENAFATIRSVYDELGRPEGTPLATWQDAFKPHDFILLAEQIEHDWRLWPLEFARNDQTPGSGLPIPTLWQHMVRVLDWVAMLLRTSPHANEPAPHHATFSSELHHLLSSLRLSVESEELNGGLHLIRLAQELASHLEQHEEGKRNLTHHHLLAEILDHFSTWLEHHLQKRVDDDEMRRLVVLIDFSTSCIRGVLREGLMAGRVDFDDLDELDMVDWLRKHGATEITCNSGLIHGMYDLMLAYRNGDVDLPLFGAGSFLHFAIRMALTYRGAIFWKMQAGMGDTIFSPIYELLKRRGVSFRFFHRVRNLALSDDRSRIEAIEMGVQATVRNGEYDPLVDIVDLPCWPSTPLYDQLVEGEELKEKGINLESFWSGWDDPGERRLTYGEDFDEVVLAIPVGAHPSICPELIEARPEWQRMVEHVETTRTLAMQLWMKPDLKGLGWSGASPIMDSYAQPFNTWADMSQLIGRETWPSDHAVGSVAYFCGPMKGGIPGPEEMDAPGIAKEDVKKEALKWLDAQCSFLWPLMKLKDGEGVQLDWEKLVDPENRSDEERFNAQYWRANIDPTERYVLSVPGSTAHRLRPGNSGFDNLYLAGDWTWNPFNVGCVEATVTSGMMAANAILGKPEGNGIEGFNRS